MLRSSRRLIPRHPPAGDQHPTVADAVLFGFRVSVVYAVLIIAFADAESSVGELVRSWIEMTSRIFQMVFAFVPEPARSTGADISSGITTYRHVLAACLLIATASFVASQSHWPYWAAQLRGRLHWVSGRRLRDAALFGHSQMVLGLISTMLLLLFAEYRLGETGTYLYAHSWTFLRAPVLAALAHWFACYAAAFRLCIQKPETGLKAADRFKLDRNRPKSRSSPLGALIGSVDGHWSLDRSRRAPFPAPDVTNAASISGQSMRSEAALQRTIVASFQAAPTAPKNGT